MPKRTLNAFGADRQAAATPPPPRRVTFRARRGRDVLFASVAGGALAAAAAAWASPPATSSVTEIGTLNNNTSALSFANAISADGLVVVGVNSADKPGGGSQDLAVMWTAAGGLTSLGTFGGSLPGSSAFAVNADGTVIVGESTVDLGFGFFGQHAFRWTQGGGMVDLGTLPNFSDNSAADGASADGSVVVGTSFKLTDNVQTGSHAFRWTAASGLVDIGAIAGMPDSTAAGVNSDGSVIVGASGSLDFTGSGGHAYRWTAASGMVDLGTIGAVTGTSAASAVNADGSVVVGGSSFDSSSDSHAFRWTQATGMVDLGTINGVTGSSSASGVSADGSVIVGNSVVIAGNPQDEAFRWTVATGMADLNTLLTNAGVTMTGIELLGAAGVSADGQFIVGEGDFADGQHKAYV
ncbi:MAG: hypothetical protein ACHP7N_15350, partial [Caulobacterales bacterium]